MQIKTIMRYHLTLVRMAIAKKNLQRINVGQGMGKRESPYTVGRDAKYAATVEDSIEVP